MPATYTLIASNTLSSSAASVTFSAIPGTYTDLVLRISARRDDSGGTFAEMFMTFNNITTTTYSETSLVGDGSSASSERLSNQSKFQKILFDDNGATSDTFGNLEIYIPSYTASQNKPVSVFAVAENNATAGRNQAEALLFRNTAAITSIELTNYSGRNFVTGSSFFLYGIKNS